jgi:hypothetical protein
VKATLPSIEQWRSSVNRWSAFFLAQRLAEEASLLALDANFAVEEKS